MECSSKKEVSRNKHLDQKEDLKLPNLVPEGTGKTRRSHPQRQQKEGKDEDQGRNRPETVRDQWTQELLLKEVK